MRSQLAGLRTITLPSGATVTPRIVIGPDLPATLTGASPDFTFTAAILMYFNATDYDFEAVGWYNVPGPFAFQVKVLGTYDTTHGFFVDQVLSGISTPGTMIRYFGSDIYNSVPTEWRYRDGTVWLTSTARMKWPSGGDAGWGNVGIGYRLTGFLSVAGEAAIPAASWDVEPTFAAVTNRVYRFRWRGQIGSAAAGAMYGTVRCRIGSATIAGTEVARTFVDSPTNIWSPTRHGWGFGTYTGAGGTITVSLTAQKNAGAAGNMLLDSDPAAPVLVEIDDMGDVNTNPQYAAYPTFT